MQNLPRRKQNRIPNYNYSQNGAYYITICIEHRRQILSRIEGDDARVVLLPYGQVVESYIKKVPEITKYVIMPDHIHMMIEIQNSVASESSIKRPQSSRVANIVRSLKTLVTKRIDVSIFQRGYYDHAIRNQQDYDETWEYIDNNPRKWILQKRGYE